MSRLARNEVLRQYKKLHREDVALQQQQELQRQHAAVSADDREGGGGDAYTGDGDGDVFPTTSPAEVVHALHEFQDIGGDSLAPLVRKGSAVGATTAPPSAAKAFPSASVDERAGRSGDGRAGALHRPAHPAVPGRDSLLHSPTAPSRPVGRKEVSATSSTSVTGHGVSPACEEDEDDEDEFPDPTDVAAAHVTTAAAVAAPPTALSVSVPRRVVVVPTAAPASAVDTVSSSCERAGDATSTAVTVSAVTNRTAAVEHGGEAAYTPPSGGSSPLPAPHLEVARQEAAAAAEVCATDVFDVSAVTLDDGAAERGRKGRPQRSHTDSSFGSLGVQLSAESLGSPLGRPPAARQVRPGPLPPRSPLAWVPLSTRDSAETAGGQRRDIWRTSPSAAERSPSDESGEWPAPGPASAPAASSRGGGQGGWGVTVPVSFWEAVFALYADQALWKDRAAPVAAPLSSSPARRGGGRRIGLFACCGSGGREDADDVVDKTAVALPPSAAAATTGAPRSRPAHDAGFVTALQALPLDRHHAVEERVLRAVYDGLRGAGAGAGGPVSNASPAWETVGFQGSNPGTDLRASGLLGLLAILYVANTYPLLTSVLWQVCNPGGSGVAAATPTEPSRDLPCVLICFNLLGLALEAVRRGGEDKAVIASQANRASCFTAHERATGKGAAAVDGAFTTVGPSDVAGGTTALLESFPLLHTVCEALVGALVLFLESWQQLRGARRPTLPSVADFGTQKAKLRDTLGTGGVPLLMRAALRARTRSAVAKMAPLKDG